MFPVIYQKLRLNQRKHDEEVPPRVGDVTPGHMVAGLQQIGALATSLTTVSGAPVTTTVREQPAPSTPYPAPCRGALSAWVQAAQHVFEFQPIAEPRDFLGDAADYETMVRGFENGSTPQEQLRHQSLS